MHTAGLNNANGKECHTSMSVSKKDGDVVSKWSVPIEYRDLSLADPVELSADG